MVWIHDVDTGEILGDHGALTRRHGRGTLERFVAIGKWAVMNRPFGVASNVWEATKRRMHGLVGQNWWDLKSDLRKRRRLGGKSAQIVEHIPDGRKIDHLDMSNTAFSNTVACLDLGSLSPYSERCPKYNEDDIHARTVYGAMDSGVFSSLSGKKAWHIIGLSTYDNASAVSGKPAYVSTSTGANIGSIAFIEEIAEKPRVHGTEITVVTPTYIAGGVGPGDPQQSSMKFLVSKQHLEFKFKNISSAGIATNETPVYITAYWCMLKDDYIQDRVNTGVTKPLTTALANGFSQKAGVQTSGTPGLPAATDQAYFVNFTDNTFLQKDIRVLDSKKFVLTNGQVGTLTVNLNKFQMYDLSHRMGSVAFGSGLGDYSPLGDRRGTQFMIIQQHGCVFAGAASGTTANIVGIEASKVGVLMTRRCNVRYIAEALDKDLIRHNVQTTPAVKLDVDLDHTTTA